VTEEQQYHPVCMCVCVSTRGTYIGGSADGVDGRLMMQIVHRSTADVIKQLHTHTDTLDAHVHSPPMTVMGLLQLRYEHDSSTIRLRFERDTTSYEELCAFEQ